MNIERVASADGTSIAFEKTGDGPPLILVGGAFCGRGAAASGTPLAARLAHRFTVFSYDRRGRGESGKAPPDSIEREIEDLAAVVDAAGGAASAFGNSSGALLALDAAARGLAMPKLVLFEPPVILDASRARAFEVLAEELDAAARENRRDEAVELFLTRVVQVPAQAIEGMRASPRWPGVDLAHTLGADLRITARGPARLDGARSVRASTLLLQGGASPPWMRDAIGTLAAAIPGAIVRSLERQTHDVDPATLAQAIEAFLGESI